EGQGRPRQVERVLAGDLGVQVELHDGTPVGRVEEVGDDLPVAEVGHDVGRRPGDRSVFGHQSSVTRSPARKAESSISAKMSRSSISRSSARAFAALTMSARSATYLKPDASPTCSRMRRVFLSSRGLRLLNDVAARAVGHAPGDALHDHAAAVVAAWVLPRLL